MRMVLPEPADPIDPFEVYAAAQRPAPAGRPWVLVNMVASVDGGTAVGGVSGPLGGEPDKAVFPAVRALADVILVAAGTVRAEGYAAPKVSERARSMREARGQQVRPRLAVVSSGADVDLAALRPAGDPPPLLYTTAATAEAGVEPPDAAEVVAAGAERVDVTEVVADLGRRGTGVVLCEGGPSLNGQLLAADLVDEVCLTLAPSLIGGDSARIAHGGDATLHAFALAHVLEQDGVLLLRYERRR